MRLILDTNIVMKALIKKSQTRAILLNPNHQFYLPEYALEEIERHLTLIQRKTALSEGEIKLILSTLLTNIDIIPSETISPHMPEARKIMHGIDEDDAPFLASALSISCDARISKILLPGIHAFRCYLEGISFLFVALNVEFHLDYFGARIEV